jgi:DNA-binding LacI/PurR family transcriptional regulator
MSTKKANIYDVAQLAGVSHQTVSRVLNNHPSLKPATREKVEKAIARLEYRPNQAARQLVTSQSRLIGLLVSGTELYGPAGILKSIESEARSEGYFVVTISVLSREPKSWLGAIDQLRGLNIDGIITVALPREVIDEVERALPDAALVVVDTEPSKDFDAININNLKGGILATEHLISLGHERIAHISGPENQYEADQRKNGYLKVMKKAKFVPQIFQGDWSTETGLSLGIEMFSSKILPTAVFCANDHLALGVIKAASLKGLRVPGDVSIIGFDDIPEAQYLIPSLTTVKQDFIELGKIVISRVLENLKGESSHETLLVQPTLTVRDSTAQLTGKKRK